MIGKNTLIQILANGLGGLLTFLTLSLAARWFGPEILGQFAYLFGLIGLFMAFSDLGFSRAQVHFSATGKDLGAKLGTFLSWKLVLLTLATLAAVVAAVLSPAPVSSLLALVLLLEWFSRLAEAVLITFESLQRSLPSNLVRLTAKLGRLIAIILLAKAVTPLNYGLTLLVEAVVLLILSFWLLRQFLPLSFKRPLFKDYWHYSLPFFAIVPLSYLQDSSLIVILKQLQSEAVVGFYSAALQLTWFIKALAAAVMVYFFPQISRLFQERAFDRIQSYTDQAVKYLLIFFTPVFMIVFLMRREIITLVLGPSFLPAVRPFAWLLLGVYLLMIFSAYDQVLIATKNHRPLVLVNLFSLLIVISLSWLLVPQFSAMGSAWASLTAWLVSGIWHLRLVVTKTKLSLFKPAFNFILPAAALLFLSQTLITFWSAGIVLKLSLSLLVVLIYLSWLVGFKLITKLDFKYLKTVLKL